VNQSHYHIFNFLIFHIERMKPDEAEKLHREVEKEIDEKEGRGNGPGTELPEGPEDQHEAEGADCPLQEMPPCDQENQGPML
jgi:hypothetical protein